MFVVGLDNLTGTVVDINDTRENDTWRDI